MADKIEWGGTTGPWHSTDIQGCWAIYDYYGECLFEPNYYWPDAIPACAEIDARATAEVPAMVQALRAAAEHIELMLTGIANGDAEAGRRFAEKDPIYTNIRAILARVDGEAA